MTWAGRKTVIGVAAVVVAAALTVSLILVFGGGKPKPVHTVAAPASPSPSPTPKPKPKPKLCPPGKSPFTGERIGKPGPVLAVKIDNIVYARPQTGLTKADIVYVLPVEGGLTRFLAIFSSHMPPVVGPVRSTRYDDLRLLRQFGRPAFAFSGAQPRLQPVTENDPHIVNLYAGVVGGYYRNNSRPAPYNLYASTRDLLRDARGRESRARCIGFRFGSPPKGGRKARSVSLRYPSASYRFTWTGGKYKRWLVWIDGARARTTEGPQMSASTVVIQHVIVRRSKYKEYGVPPPYALTTGRGWALVLRNGRKYRVRWSRLKIDGGTTYTYRGKPFTFAKGPVWVLFTGNPHAEAG